jgi:hypothetical protein
MLTTNQVLDKMPCSDDSHLPDRLESWMNEIRLDSFKAGAEWAAEMCIKYKEYGDMHPPIFTRGAILSASSNLKEIPKL